MSMGKEQLNNICLDCVLLGKECAGTSNQVWTGCVSRKTKQEETEHGKERSFGTEKRS